MLCDLTALFGVFLETNKHQNLTRLRVSFCGLGSWDSSQCWFSISIAPAPVNGPKYGGQTGLSTKGKRGGKRSFLMSCLGLVVGLSLLACPCQPLGARTAVLNSSHSSVLSSKRRNMLNKRAQQTTHKYSTIAQQTTVHYLMFIIILVTKQRGACNKPSTLCTTSLQSV